MQKNAILTEITQHLTKKFLKVYIKTIFKTLQDSITILLYLLLYYNKTRRNPINSASWKYPSTDGLNLPTVCLKNMSVLKDSIYTV